MQDNIYTLVSLNTWNGKEWDAYQQFLRDTRSTTDILCLQEVNNGKDAIFSARGSRINNLDETVKILEANHAAFINREQFWSNHDPVQMQWGLAIIHGIENRRDLFIKEWTNHFLLNVMDHSDEVRMTGSDLPVVLQKVQFITKDEKIFSVFNIHGHYAGKGVGKIDTPKRLLQAEQIREHLLATPEPWILAGDLNMNPDTKSLELIASVPGVRNLIEEFDIKTTRTSLYPEEKRKTEPFADYIFTKDIEVVKFKVDASSTASDHAPLYLEFGVK